MDEKDLLVQPGADTARSWEGFREHQLRFEKCTDCGLVRWPPSLLCPRCLSGSGEWIVSKGRGKLYSFAIYHRPFHPLFEGKTPYVTGIVELDEGPHLITTIVESEPSSIECGMQLEVVWEEIGGGLSMPKFRPART